MIFKTSTFFLPGFFDFVMMFENGTFGKPLMIKVEIVAMSGPLTNNLKLSAVVKLGKTSRFEDGGEVYQKKYKFK